jgi:hypothetical protein
MSRSAFAAAFREAAAMVDELYRRLGGGERSVRSPKLPLKIFNGRTPCECPKSETPTWGNELGGTARPFPHFQ